MNKLYLTLISFFVFFASFGQEIPVQATLIVGETNDEVFVVVEIMPTYSGGTEAMYGYLKANLKYPEEELKTKTEGLVVVNFIVEKDGSLSNIKIVKGASANFDEEALRVVREMPVWIPGTQRDKPVRVSINLPIRFSLK